MKRNIDGQIGPRLAKLRKDRGFSQAWLAKRIGVSVGTIQAYERRRARLPSERLKEIAAALRCEPGDILKAIALLTFLFGL